MLERIPVNRALREVVALVYVGTILGAWIWATVYRPEVRLNPVVDLLFYLFAFAAGYVIFGKRVLNAAIDSYQKLRGDSGDT